MPSRGWRRSSASACSSGEHRQVGLTEAGARFFADVTLGLSHIRKSAEELRSLALDAHVTLSASTAFASFWMVPRLQKFRDELPGIDLRIQTADRDLDLVAEGIPLGIRGGSAEIGRTMSLPLAAEEIYAVAGQLCRPRHGMPRTLPSSTGQRLIHLEEPFRAGGQLERMVRSAGITGRAVNRGLLINDYVR